MWITLWQQGTASCGSCNVKFSACPSGRCIVLSETLLGCVLSPNVLMCKTAPQCEVSAGIQPTLSKEAFQEVSASCCGKVLCHVSALVKQFEHRELAPLAHVGHQPKCLHVWHQRSTCISKDRAEWLRLISAIWNKIFKITFPLLLSQM